MSDPLFNLKSTFGDTFASTRNRSPLQTTPLGQLPGGNLSSSIGTPGLPIVDPPTFDPIGVSDLSRFGEDPSLGGGTEDVAENLSIDTNFTQPDIGEIPENIQELLALFDTDPDTPGVQGRVATLAGASAEEIAASFGLGPEYASYFSAVNQGQLGGALGNIGRERTFGLGQAQDILGLGKVEARQQFGAQAAGLRSGLLGLANLTRQRQAASGFAGSGAPGAALGAGRRQAEQQLGRAAGGFRGTLTGLQERLESTQAGVQSRAQSGLTGLLNQIAQQVGGFGSTAAGLIAGGAKVDEGVREGFEGSDDIVEPDYEGSSDGEISSDGRFEWITDPTDPGSDEFGWYLRGGG